MMLYRAPCTTEQLSVKGLAQGPSNGNWDSNSQPFYSVVQHLKIWATTVLWMTPVSINLTDVVPQLLFPYTV